MKQTIAIVALSFALVASWTWFLSRDGDVSGSSSASRLSTPAPAAEFASGTAPASDQLAALQQVPEGSPDYAKARRTIGYKIFGMERGDWDEAKRHVDLALKASPDDPKVLEDAGRVYLKLGKTSEATDMLKRANTSTARRVLAESGDK